MGIRGSTVLLTSPKDATNAEDVDAENDDAPPSRSTSRAPSLREADRGALRARSKEVVLPLSAQSAL